MKLNMKKLTVALLSGAMALGMMLPGVSAGEAANAAAVPAGTTITVDGVKEAAWDAAEEYTMVNEVWGDSRGDAATKKESSTVKFRMMYSDAKVYMLVEITDDAFITGASDTHWKNDSIFIYVSEDGNDRNKNSEKSYVLAAYPAEYDQTKVGGTGFICRNASLNQKTKEHAVTVNGNVAVMELSFELNTKNPTANDTIYIDLQYNDQDTAPSGENTRTIVWSWSSNCEYGPNNSGTCDWGSVTFAEAVKECTHEETELKDAKEPTETEKGYTGDKVCKDCGVVVEEGKDIDPTGTPAKTGDAMLAVSAVAILAVGAAAVISRRRKIED